MPATFSFVLLPPPPISTLFPYTTLFRSQALAAFNKLVQRQGLIAYLDDSGRCYLRSTGTGVSTATFSQDRKSTRLNSSHITISYAVFCLKKKKSTKLNSYTPLT